MIFAVEQKGEPMRLIDADESLKRINDILPRRTESDYQKGIAVGMAMAKVAIHEQTTVDAEPVRHGRWEDKPHKMMGECPRCSVCGSFDPIKYRYCPNCGAKMDGGKSDG